MTPKQNENAVIKPLATTNGIMYETPDIRCL